MDLRSTSFTAANAIPVKIFRSNDLVESLNRGHIPPVHVQLIPTNRCNLNCNFCSCKNRDKDKELPVSVMLPLINKLKLMGCKSVTITGGGEPLMYREILNLLYYLHVHDIKVGLVTNGLLLGKLFPEDLSDITWCRVSCADDRKGDARTFDIIDSATQRGSKIDWAFSYVISNKFDPENLKKYIEFANEHNFTHIRVVTDLCDLNGCPDMKTVKGWMKEYGVDDSRVIYQGRKEYDPGQKNCWISLLKPVIGPDSKIFPCCGVQYSHQVQDLDLPESMCMGNIAELDSIYQKQIPFDGSKCDRCYYKNYNDIIGMMMSDVQHKEFV